MHLSAAKYYDPGCQEAIYHRPRKHEVRAVNWPPLFQVGSKIYLLTPTLLTCTKHVYFRVRVTIMHHQRYSLRPLRTQNWHVYVLQSLLFKLHSRTVILCPQNTENIHLINNERKPSRASSFATFPPRYGTDKMDLNDLCQTFVGSSLKGAERVSLANRRHYLNVRWCAELYVDCSVCSALL